ncbi:MAG: hypothetical protein WCP77_07235, partial [Roseococcus sp.]
ATTAAEVTPRRTIAEPTGRTEVTARRTVAKSTAPTRATEIAARRTIAEATARGTSAATGATLEFGDARNETATLPVRSDLAHQNIVGIGLLDARIRQC